MGKSIGGQTVKGNISYRKLISVSGNTMNKLRAISIHWYIRGKSGKIEGKCGNRICGENPGNISWLMLWRD
jgi:hypothetical protein